MSLLAGTSVVVETRWFPPLSVDVSGAGGKPGWVVRILQPKVTVSVQGSKVASAAPAGEPVPNEWRKVKIGLAIALGLAVFGVLRIIK